MSRGGRGGLRGGSRGRGGGGGVVDRWADEEVDGRPADLFPAYSFILPRILSDAEESSIHKYRLQRQNIHDSPLHYTLGASPQPSTYFCVPAKRLAPSATGSAKTAGGSITSPFRDMPTYTTRFYEPPRLFPNFSTYPHSKRLFPRELQDVLPDEDDEDQPARKKRTTKLNVRSLGTLRNAEDRLRGDDEEEVEDLQTRWARLDGDLEAGEAGEEGGARVAEEEEEEEAPGDDEEDYAFEEDEEGDYNAEQYFEDGASEHDDGDDGGGDDGIYQ